MKKIVLVLILFLSSLSAKTYFYENKKRIELKKDYSKGSTSKIKYFKNRKGESIAVKNQILIKLKAVAVITAIIQEFDLNIIKKINNNKFILEVKNIDEVFWKSNEINRRTAVSYAYPIYINKTQREKRAGKNSESAGGIENKSKQASSGADISSAFKNR